MFFTTYLPLIFGLNVPFLRSLFVIRSSARAARTVICSSFVRSLFVFCSSFVRHLFVHCSSFVRLLFVFCSFIVRLLFVLCSSFLYLPVRLAPSFVRHSFVPLFRYYTPSPWERVGERIFCSSARVARTCLCGSHLPVWLTPLTLHFLLNCFPILIKILHRDFFSVKANIFKLFCYLTAFAYNDDSEVF